MQKQNKNPDKTRIEIPEMRIEIGNDYVIIEESTYKYTFYLSNSIVEELKQWWIESEKPKKYKKKTLLYLCRAFSLMGLSGEFQTKKRIMDLEKYRCIFEEYINRIWKNVYT